MSHAGGIKNVDETSATTTVPSALVAQIQPVARSVEAGRLPIGPLEVQALGVTADAQIGEAMTLASPSTCRAAEP